MPTLLTAREVCAHFGTRYHILNYAVREFGPEPASRVGAVRLWSSDQLPQLAESLAKTASRSTNKARRRAAEVSQ